MHQARSAWRGHHASPTGPRLATAVCKLLIMTTSSQRRRQPHQIHQGLNSHARSTPKGPQKRSRLRSKSLQKNLGRRLARNRRARTNTPRSAACPSKCTAKLSASKHREAQRYQTPSPRKRTPTYTPRWHSATEQKHRESTPYPSIVTAKTQRSHCFLHVS